MLPYAAYKVVHYLGIFMLVTVLSATLARSAKEGLNSDPWRKRLGMIHGIALFLIVLGGFGMLAKLDAGFPGWIVAKLGIWLVFAGLIAARKSADWSARALVLVPLLAALAGWIAYAKPF
ncbi:MAG TPA: hypothetical protein VJ997_14990 [Longimicrobiales bacterium]|nr:hypothetical protein [Longimicrobiales bacterium]